MIQPFSVSIVSLWSTEAIDLLCSFLSHHLKELRSLSSRLTIDCSRGSSANLGRESDPLDVQMVEDRGKFDLSWSSSVDSLLDWGK